MPSFTLPLDAPEAPLAIVGGKGAGLSRLAQAGFPVPPGFVITTAAYRAFVEANSLQEHLEAMGRQASPDDPASLEAASRAIRRLFERGSIPEPVAAAIVRAYRHLSPAAPLPVAVRSSATAEDLPEASFAGQQETYLNVQGEEALLEAVRWCWASLWTARAIAYRARQGIVPAAVGLAVVVQQMVPADVSGILFTANPTTGARDEIVINAAWGLGEAIVGGRVTPDTFVVEKATGRVRRRIVAEKGVMSVPAAGGTAEVEVEAGRRHVPVLDDAQVARLARLGREIEAHFGAPQDIEWCLAGSDLFVLQSRPITALPPEPSGREVEVPGDDDWPVLEEKPPQPFDLWTRVNVGEAWPYPVSPLLWSGIPLSMNEGARYFLRGLRIPYLDDIQWGRRFYGRIYYNEGAIAHILTQELGLPGSFVDAALGSRRRSHPRRRERFRPLRFLRRLPAFLSLIAGRLGIERELEALFPQIDRWVADFLERDLEQADDAELWAEIRQVWVKRSTQVINLHTAVSGSAMAAFSLLQQLLARWCGREELAHDLVTGLSGVYAAEMGLALWEMAQQVRALGLDDLLLDHPPEVALARLRETPQARPVIQMLERFLQRHGHRCPNEGEWLHPRWAEAPEQVIEIVAGYLRAGDRVNPAEAEARQRRRREEAIAWVEAHLGPLRRAIFRRVLARAQQAVRLRDNGRHYITKIAFPFVRIYRVLGRRWTERGWLREPNDVFFLTVPDVEKLITTGDPAAAGLDLPALVAGRRRAYEHWFGVEAPEVIGPDGRPIELPPPDEPPGSVLQGLPASGGRVRGTARIIHDPREATRLRPGEILVTRATDPGWTPIFPLVAGLVLEVGGQLSHGAIVAREYGVPAVVNVPEATRRIRDGQTITVDGTTGRVSIGP